MSVTCPSCSREFTKVGGHWRQSDCPYPEVTQRQREIISGLLMGDGSVVCRDMERPSLKVKSVEREFLEWVQDELGVVASSVGLDTTAEDSAASARRNGLDESAKAENYRDVYRLLSRNHPVFREFASWYNDGEKTFPSDLALTPIIVKMWYCGDGSLRRWCDDRPSAYISSVNEEHRPEFLVSLFEDVGFSPTMTNKNLIFSVDETEGLLDWMGGPPPGFDYKWL